MMEINEMASNASRAAHGDPAHAAPEAQPSAAFGKWYWSPGDREVTCQTAADDPGDLVCEAPGEHAEASFAKWPRHARLIAAAPDMYEALLAIRDWLLDSGQLVDDGISHPAFIKANNAANAAIARAENP